jgi:hypothetical protein
MVLDLHAMVTAKHQDKKEPPPVRHSGHGAASLIPHLKGRRPSEQAQADDAASGAELTQPQPQPRPQGTAGEPPQAG